MVLQAGMPTMMLTLVIGARFELDTDFIASAILVTTVAVGRHDPADAGPGRRRGGPREGSIDVDCSRSASARSRAPPRGAPDATCPVSCSASVRAALIRSMDPRDACPRCGAPYGCAHVHRVLADRARFSRRAAQSACSNRPLSQDA